MKLRYCIKRTRRALSFISLGASVPNFLSITSDAAKARSESPILTFTHPLNSTSRCPGPSDSSASSISTLTFAIAVVGPSKSTPASRTRTSSAGFWLVYDRRNGTFQSSRHSSHPPGHPPGHHLRRYRFSLKRNPVQQHTISKEATENVWLDSVRSTIQQWTDVNCSMTEADKMPQSSTGYPRPFQALCLVPIRRPAHDSPFICPILTRIQIKNRLVVMRTSSDSFMR